MSDRNPNYAVSIILAASPLGWFGAHHFYLGNKRKGIVYLVFSLTVIPAALAVVDSFILIYRGHENFIERYGDDEDLEQYHLNELRKQNPMLAQQVYQQLQQENDDVDPEEIAEKVNEAVQGNSDKSDEKADNEHESENNDERNTNDIDYSNYYGPWE